MSAAPKRLTWFDVVRGLAAALVVFLHTWEIWVDQQQIALGRDPVSFGIMEFAFSGLLDIGKIGVGMFFLVSGYVIPLSLENKPPSRFLIARFWRLYPAYWLSLVAGVFVYGITDLSQIAANFTMFQAFLGERDLIGVYWTLQIEWIFYFVCVVLALLRVLEDNRIIQYCFWVVSAFSLLSAALRYSFGVKIPVALFIALQLMFLAVTFSRLDRGRFSDRRSLLVMVSGFVILIIPVCYFAYSSSVAGDLLWIRYGISYCIALGGFFYFRKIKPEFSILCRLGLISYSWYLFHPLVAYGVSRILGANLPFFTMLLLVFTISIVVAWLSFNYVEKPMHSLASRIGKGRA